MCTVTVVQYGGKITKLIEYMHRIWASQVAQRVKNAPAMQGTQVSPLGWEDPLEKEMATHSSILAWEIPCMKEPGRLWSMGSDSTEATEHTGMHAYNVK